MSLLSSVRWRVLIVSIILGTVVVVRTYFFLASVGIELFTLLPPRPSASLHDTLRHQYLAYIQDKVVHVINGLGNHSATYTAPELSDGTPEEYLEADASTLGNVAIVGEISTYNGGISFMDTITLYSQDKSAVPKVIYSDVSLHSPAFLKHLRFSPDGNFLAFVNDRTSTIHIFSAATGLPFRNFTLPHNGQVDNMQWSDNGTLSVLTYEHGYQLQTPETDSGTLTIDEMIAKFPITTSVPGAFVIGGGTKSDAESERIRHENLMDYVIIRLDINTGNISYLCYVVSEKWWQIPRYRCKESPEKIALFGEDDHQVHMPKLSSDGRIIFSYNSTESILYRSWLEGYDRQTKKVFNVALIRWYFPWIP